jgi:hypothetical protein
MTPEEAVQAANDAYDTAEAEYLRLLREDSARHLLASAARQVRDAAERWEAADNKRAFTRPDQASYSDYDDVPEVLHTLWTDIAAAYEGRPAAE